MWSGSFRVLIRMSVRPPRLYSRYKITDFTLSKLDIQEDNLFVAIMIWPLFGFGLSISVDDICRCYATELHAGHHEGLWVIDSTCAWRSWCRWLESCLMMLCPRLCYDYVGWYMFWLCWIMLDDVVYFRWHITMFVGILFSIEYLKIWLVTNVCCKNIKTRSKCLI